MLKFSAKTTPDVRLPGPIRSGPNPWGAVLDWLLLPTLLFASPLLYLSNARHNLPVSTAVDERIGLGILGFFRSGSLNPHMFLYPTLYYYITYAFTRFFPPTDALFAGRLLNLSFVGLLAYLGYRFCRDILFSRPSGLLAAGLILFSPLMIQSGEYIATDVLLSCFALLFLLALSLYFRQPTDRRWLWAMVILGLAVACKYTAAILFVVYVLLEFAGVVAEESSGETAHIGGCFSRKTLARGFFGLGLSVVLLALAVPDRWAVHVALRLQAEYVPVTWTIFLNKQKTAAEFLQAIHKLRRAVAGAGLAIGALGFAIQKRGTLYRLLSPRRLYFGLLIVVATVAITTPYWIVTPGRFLADISDVLVANVIAKGQPVQWRIYLEWLRHDEGALFVVLGAAGVLWAVVRDLWNLRVPLLFVLLYATTLATSHRGYARYLTLLLPVLYIFAADLIVRVWSLCSTRSTLVIKLLVLVIAVGAIAQMWQKQRALHLRQSHHDEFWQSYQVALRRRPPLVLYEGYAPAAELAQQGISVRQIFWEQLEGRSVADLLPCGGLLIEDLRSSESQATHMPDDPRLQTLFESDEGYGQRIRTRADCR